MYGDGPNSPGRRERESWDGVSVLPGLPDVIDPTASAVIFGARGCPKILDLRSKIKENRTEGTEGLVLRI